MISITDEISYITWLNLPNPPYGSYPLPYGIKVAGSDIASWTVTGLPPGMTASLVDARTIGVTGTPTVAGGYWLHVSVTGTDATTDTSDRIFIGVYLITGTLIWPGAPYVVQQGVAVIPVNLSSLLTIAGPGTITGAFDSPDHHLYTVDQWAAYGDPVIFSATGLPAGLTISGHTLSGTPTTDGSGTFTLTAANSFFTCSLVVAYTVAPITVTPLAASVVAGHVFSIELTTSVDAATLTASGLPSGAALVGKTLTGTVAAAGTSAITLTIHYGSDTVTTTFTLTVEAAVIVFADETELIEGWIREPLLALVAYSGSGTVDHWYLVGGPPGVEITAADECAGSPYTPGSLVVMQISGPPGAAGIFEATLIVQVCIDGVPTLARRSVTFAISGGLFLSWFHRDPQLRDMQLMLRTREVYSYAFVDQLWLKRGDDAKFHLIIRDGSLPTLPVTVTTNTDGSTTASQPEANFGHSVVSPSRFSAMWLVIRQIVDAKDVELLRIGGAPLGTETIAGRALFVFDFEVESNEIEDAIQAATEKGGQRLENAPASIALDCVGEFNWIENGRVCSSLNFPILLLQDLDR